MALSALELFSFGGVDSRSNPLNEPQGRSLRCRNFQPKDDGELQLRYGFTTVTMTGSTSTASYNSLIPYTFYDPSGVETPYLVLGQGANLRVLNIATGAVTSPTVRGATISTSSRDAYYLANGKIHFGNGTQQKWFDGTTFRDNGLRAPTAAEVANVVIVPGVLEMTTAQNSSVTITPAAGGSFSATTLNGLLFYVSAFDTATNELGPATQFAGSGRVTHTFSSAKYSFTGLPAINAVQVKLISRTVDGGAIANFCTNTSTAATLTRSGATATVTATAHGCSTGDIIRLSGFTDTKYNQPWFITVTNANVFTFSIFSAASIYSAADSGTTKRLVSVAAATTTVDITSTATDTSFTVNQDWGIAASAVGGSQPGTQFYISIYNRTAGQHVGNRIAIGGRQANVTRCNFRINGVPDLTGTDSEWEMLIGRTGDGGVIPYVVTDNLSNWISLQSAQLNFFALTQAAIDGNKELPTRNGIVPAGMNMFARVGDRIYGGIAGLPTVSRSASEADSLNGNFVGRPEQSWAPTDIDTFPTAQGLTGMFDEDRGAFYATKNHGAVFADLGQGFAWIGPWYGAGMAGSRSWCDAPYGKFWVTGHKQLATMKNGIPTPISDEYEAALLSKIGDAFLSLAEMAYIRDHAKRIDKLVIKAQDSNGVPFVVNHDFRLRDARAPEGQGYEYLYSAPLATDFPIVSVRDANGAQRIWAGASTGQLYQLETGANDASAEFSADYIELLNAGPNRPSVPELRWYGDQRVVMSIGRRLDTSTDSNAAITFEKLTPDQGAELVAGEDGNSYYKARLTTTKLNKAYIRIQLDSHSADGNLDFNDPPHVPLETYGRVILGQGIVGAQQGV